MEGEEEKIEKAQPEEKKEEAPKIDREFDKKLTQQFEEVHKVETKHKV